MPTSRYFEAFLFIIILHKLVLHVSIFVSVGILVLEKPFYDCEIIDDALL